MSRPDWFDKKLKQAPLAKAAVGGLGSVVAPAAPLPSQKAQSFEVPISQEWETERRDLTGGRGVLPVKQQNGYFAPLSKPGMLQQHAAIYNPNPVQPGAEFTLVLGGFKVPDAMIVILRGMSFFANRLVGGSEEALAPGVFGRNLSFAAVQNGQQLGMWSFVETPPTTLFTYGAFDNSQLPPQVPSTVQSIGTGPAMGPSQVYYIPSGMELVFLLSVLPSLPETIISSGVVFDGLLIDALTLQERMRDV